MKVVVVLKEKKTRWGEPARNKTVQLVEWKAQMGHRGAAVLNRFVPFSRPS